MEVLSKEIQLEGLKELKQALNTLVELEKQRAGKLDLITLKELLEILDISEPTLNRWEDMGLKRYQAPVDGARKIFYRPSDIYLFLAVS
ncbi:hypothetical protein [Streptococcus sp. E17BB]|uniref:hypothetical protein n=1 Tax=Streptococcus sp. E17BB TaxID=3278714 RepID=UPI00359E3EF8